jgi:PAS domain S-box-containing protein
VAAAVVAAEASAKFRTFFEQGASFAGLLALDGTVVEVNRLSLEACGFKREEIVGRKFWECPWWNRSDALMTMVRSGVREAVEGRMFRRETPYFIADGSERMVDMTLSPVTDDAGRVLFVAPTGMDITERKKSERELHRLATSLAAANRNQTEFLAVLAHELRNPLAPIRSGLELLRRAADKPAMIKRVGDMMERQLAQLVRLIDDLLDIARITSGKVELKKARVDLRRVLATAIETATPMIEAAGHELRYEPPNEILLLDADAARVAQVISNLLNNAAKYTPAGGRIELSARREGSEVAIAVTDSGVGIAPEHLGSVFGMFTQVERNKSRAEGGLGVGLSLVRHLVELHDGRVTAESPGIGKGSTFTVRLPLAAQDRTRHAHGDRASDTRPAIRKLRILLVDDNVDAATSLSLLLQAGGHTTEICRDGEHALACAHRFQPDVVFLDIGMPVMDGYELARALRQVPGLRDVFCVALTGWGTDGDRVRAREAGIDRHLTKPVDISEVERMLAEVPRAV